MQRQRKLYVAKAIVIMGALPLLVWAFSAGPDAGKAGVPGESTCSEASCHIGTAINGGGGSVKVTFPGAATYAPGVKQHLVVIIADPAAKMWGFQLTARLSGDPKTQAGSFTSTDGFTSVVCDAANLDIFAERFFEFRSNQTCPSTIPLAYIEHNQNGSGRLQPGSQTYEFDCTPPATAVGNITIYVAGNAANANGQADAGDHIYTANYTLSPGTAGGGNGPSIDAGGVVSGASFQPGIVPGSWLTIKGSNLSPVTDTWDKAIVNGVLPTTLDGVSVSVGGKLAYVYFISAGQINVQAPDVGTGPVPVTVTTPTGTSTAVTATVVAQSPAFFLWPNSQAIATRQDGSFAVKAGTFPTAATIAAQPGDVLILWGTGFGPTTPPMAAGQAVPSDKIYNASPVGIKLGGTDLPVFGAALSPGSAGLYQIATQVPASLADGDYPITASVGGVTSPTGVILTVKK